MISSRSKVYAFAMLVAVSACALSSTSSMAQKRGAGMAQMQQMMQGGQIPSQYMQSVPPQYQQYIGGGSAGGAGVGNQVDFQSGFNNSGNPHQSTNAGSNGLPVGIR